MDLNGGDRCSFLQTCPMLVLRDTSGIDQECFTQRNHRIQDCYFSCLGQISLTWPGVWTDELCLANTNVVTAFSMNRIAQDEHK